MTRSRRTSTMASARGRTRTASVLNVPLYVPQTDAVDFDMPDLDASEELKEDERWDGAPSKGGAEEEKEPLAPLTGRQILTIAMLAAANFASTVVFSCIAPFFPSEAKAKGSDETMTGFIFSCFELVMFFASPFFGRYMNNIGAKRCYVVGLWVTAAAIILFGFITKLPDGGVFISMCFVNRIVQSIGDAAFSTASFAITAKEFQGRVGTVIGIMSTFKGAGFSIGPTIGGALYQVGGFALPFLVLGLMLFLSGVVAVWLIPPQPKDEEKTEETKSGMMGMLRIPSVVLMCLTVTTAAISLTFLDPTLEGYLQEFNLSPVLVGLVFLLLGGFYTISAPFWGYVSDRTIYIREIMIFGAALATLGMLFTGPSPLIGLKKELWAICLGQVILGFGVGALFIPTYRDTLNVTKAAGYPDSLETYGSVSGLVTAFFCLGGFLGPTVGGAGQQSIGFAWTATVMAGLCALIGLCLAAFQIRNRCFGGETPLVVEETAPLLPAKRRLPTIDDNSGTAHLDV